LWILFLNMGKKKRKVRYIPYNDNWRQKW
jgi:hypothetical protein